MERVIAIAAGRSRRFWLAGSLVALSAAIFSAPASGLMKSEELEAVAQFEGPGCGAQSVREVDLGRGARSVRDIAPAVGTVLRDGAGQGIATITQIQKIESEDGIPALSFTAKGSELVCTSPGLFPGGWSVAVPLSASYKTFFRTYVPNKCYTPRYKPRSMILACADAGLYLTGIRWSSWNGPVAKGSGRAHMKDCVPNCAEGGVDVFASRVRLSNPRQCPDSAIYQYTRVTIIFKGDPPGPNRYRFPFPCTLSE